MVTYYVGAICVLNSTQLFHYSITTLSAPPAAPGTPSVTFSVPRQQFTITWDEPPLSKGGTVDTYFVNISGPNDLCGNGNMLPRVTEPSYTCSIQMAPQEGETYTIRVAAATCNGSLRGADSNSRRLQGKSKNTWISCW